MPGSAPRAPALARALVALVAFAGCAPPPDSPPAAAPPPVPAAVAGPPATDVFLLGLSETADGLVLRPARADGAGSGTLNVTDRAGYDNQPAFTADGGQMLYTSIREDGQADVYRYDIASGRAERVTRTPESEYSPTPLPDGTGFSAVRVEMDSTQRLWRFDGDGGDARPVLEEVRPVGYHAWIDEHTLALFVLGEPPTLRLADVRTGRAATVAESIGRSLNRVPGRRAVSFVHKADDGDWSVRVLDVDSRAVSTVAPTLIDAEDHAWTPAGSLLMGRGSVLYRWNPDAEEWWEVADLEGEGIRDITRIAVSPTGDRIAVVGRRD